MRAISVLLPLVLLAAPARADEPATFWEAEPSWQKKAAWLSVGISAAFLTAGGMLAEVAEAREADLDRLSSAVDPQTGLPYPYNDAAQRQYEDALDEGERLELYSIAAFAAAGLAAGVAVTFLFLDTPESPRVVPQITPETAALHFSWNF